MAKRKPLAVGDYVTVHMHFSPEEHNVGVCRITSLKSGADNRYIEVEQVTATDNYPVGRTWHHHDSELRRAKPPKNPVNVVFRQANPFDQLVSITQAIEGNLINIENRINKSTRDNLRLQIKCLKVLGKHIKGTHWTNETLKVV
jgi:hypothetical protein